MSNNKRLIFIDPSYPDFYQDKLFDTSDAVLNRDDSLEPFRRLRSTFNAQGKAVHTADYLMDGKIKGTINDYYSLGLLDNYPKLLGRQDVRLRGFVIMEPPAVAPRLYRALPRLTRDFELVYLHNTVGDGYSLKGVDQSKLRQFYVPQPYCKVLEPIWNNLARKKRIVVINGNHIPRSLKGQLYGKRIEAMAALAKLDAVDLYGHGWSKWWSHRSMWPPYWFNYKTLMSIYHGTCESKFDVLGRYRFCLCFENMNMKGYVTEKIFDCLYAGTVPLYLGANDIESLIPPEAYVDCRQFGSWDEMNAKIMAMSDHEIGVMREAGRAFIQGPGGLKYFDSFTKLLSDD